MDSLLQDAGNAAAIQRIETLRVDSRPEWGKMTVAQMLVHCQKPLQVAAGELKLKRGLIGLLFGRMAKKKFVVGPAPFNRSSPTDPRFRVLDEREFAPERTELIALVRRFGASRGPLSRARASA